MAASVSEEVKQFRGIAADSREVQPGFLFAALAGTRTSGAQFIEDAVKRGAVAVLGDPECADTAKALGIQFIAASNPRQALARMAAEFYGSQPSTIAAVTGTNGKTSVAAFVRQIWTFSGPQSGEPRHRRNRFARGPCVARSYDTRPRAAACRTRTPEAAGRRISGDGGIQPRTRPIPAGRAQDCGCGFHQYHARSPRLSCKF